MFYIDGVVKTLAGAVLQPSKEIIVLAYPSQISEFEIQYAVLDSMFDGIIYDEHTGQVLVWKGYVT